VDAWALFWYVLLFSLCYTFLLSLNDDLLILLTNNIAEDSQQVEEGITEY